MLVVSSHDYKESVKIRRLNDYTRVNLKALCTSVLILHARGLEIEYLLLSHTHKRTMLSLLHGSLDNTKYPISQRRAFVLVQLNTPRPRPNLRRIAWKKYSLCSIAILLFHLEATLLESASLAVDSLHRRMIVRVQSDN